MRRFCLKLQQLNSSGNRIPIQESRNLFPNWVLIMHSYIFLYSVRPLLLLLLYKINNTRTECVLMMCLCRCYSWLFECVCVYHTHAKIARELLNSKTCVGVHNGRSVPLGRCAYNIFVGRGEGQILYAATVVVVGQFDRPTG